MEFDELDAHALITTLHAGVVVHNPDTSVAYANPKALEILHLTEAQILGRDALDPLWQLLDGDKVPLSVEDYPVNRVLLTRNPVSNQEIGVIDGETTAITWVLVNAYPELNRGGQISKIVVTFIDITANKSEIPFEASLNSLSQQITVIDGTGLIQWVNDAWKGFSQENGAPSDEAWLYANYLSVCKAGSYVGDNDSSDAMSGIQSVMNGEATEFYFEYPCHSPTEQRWFMMRIRPLEWNGPYHYVISHENITERKLAEIKLEELATTDGLTGIPNRRYFDDFLEKEWLRARRLSQPVSLVLLDIDFFKPFNDNYGHVAGDKCLQQVGEALKDILHRPDDLVARYGGEEFAIILGNTDLEAAYQIAEKTRISIQALNIPHAYAKEAGCITISAGVSSISPNRNSSKQPNTLLKAADKNLYIAKEKGRNQVVAFTP
ncbi:MAG: diguanylate cyclase [Rhodospirillales bacterium]|nr:diguanylate cyclase [Rhodospirillales bacterium]